MARYPVELTERRLGPLDLLVAGFTFALVYALVQLGTGMAAPLDLGTGNIDLSPLALP